ncbi:MAG: hypothetical protein ACK5LR_00025 [Mangrovibacterium sp.]
MLCFQRFAFSALLSAHCFQRFAFGALLSAHCFQRIAFSALPSGAAKARSKAAQPKHEVKRCSQSTK